MPDPGSALVVRAAGGLGRALAARLAREGCELALAFEQDEEGAREAAEAARERGVSAFTLPGRVADPMAAGNLVEQAARRLDGLDHVVVGPRGSPIGRRPEVPDAGEAFLSVDLRSLEASLRRDLKGPLAVLQAAAEHMRPGGGRVLVVAPEAHLRAGPARAGSGAAWAGLARLVEEAGRALAPDVAVNGLEPGIVAPEGAEAVLGDAGGAGFTSADEVAKAAASLLACPRSVTGQVLRVGEGGKPGGGEEDPAPGGEERGLPGIERRVDPPDPGDRIDVGEP